MNLNSKMFNMKISPKDDRDYLLEANIVGDIVRDDFWVNSKESHIAYDQSTTSMCTGFGGAGIMSQMKVSKGNQYKRYSPASLYGNRFDDREYQGEGHYLREVLKDMRRSGVAEFEDFDYIGDVATAKRLFSELSNNIIEDMYQNRIEFFYKIDHTSVKEMYDICKKHNLPIIITYGVYQSMAQGFHNGGYIPMPQDDEEMVGGHCSYIGGFVNHDNQLKPAVVNSWGDEIFDNGIMYMPEDFPIWEAYVCMPYIPTEIRFKIGSNKYTVNGVEKTMDTVPVLKDWRTYVPLRFALEELNAEVLWNSVNSTAIVKRGNNNYYFTVHTEDTMLITLQNGFYDGFSGSKIYYEDLEERRLLTYHYLDSNDRTMIPVRKVFEYIAKCVVEWIDNTQEVVIRNY